MAPDVIEWTCSHCPAPEPEAEAHDRRRSKRAPKNDEIMVDGYGKGKYGEGGYGKAKDGDAKGKHDPTEWPYPWATPWDPNITDGRKKYSQEWCRRKGKVPPDFDA